MARSNAPLPSTASVFRFIEFHTRTCACNQHEKMRGRVCLETDKQSEGPRESSRSGH